RGNDGLEVTRNLKKKPKPNGLDSRLRGNDGGAVSVFSGKYPQAKIPLFSQKQKTKNSNLKFVIPTKVGIRFVRFRLF
ncbi:TPA: hypothetical protein ACFO2M_001640, partial [Neisseria meningitidis]